MMKLSRFSMVVIPIAILCLWVFLIGGCGKKKEVDKKEATGQKTAEEENITGLITSFAEYHEYSKNIRNDYSTSYNPEDYKDLNFEKVYGQKVDPPAFDLNVDLSGKSLSELRILRNTIYARHGLLFMDSIIRGYFNQFPWYQPVFWDPSFKIDLSKDEAGFITRVEAEEALMLKQNRVNRNGVMLENTENIANIDMFKTMPDKALSLLNEQNFFLNESNHEQLYYIYDKNNYEGIPSYVTTDLYLDLLHVYYKHLLMGLEKYDLYPLVNALVNGMYEKTLAVYSDKSISNELGPSLEFNLIYLAVAGNLLEQGSIKPPANLIDQYNREYKACREATGVGSELLKDDYFDHNQLKVRGSYVEDQSLGLYFQGVKWLVTAPMFYEDETGLMSAALFACILKDNPELVEKYNRLEKVIAAFTGEGDNLSPMQILTILKGDGRFTGLSSLTDKALIAQLVNRLKEMDPERMHAKGWTEKIAAAIDKPRVLFFPSRYNFDGDILQNLIHPLLSGDGYRLYPKGLDIFAVLGNSEAKKILLEEYKETETWPDYNDALKKMEEKFTGFKDWDINLFNKRMGLILNITRINNRYPGFMQTSAWQRRGLIASLAGWTEIKNELILYQKQPTMAEAGEGGFYPPDPVTPGYVEPNVAFWQGCLNLLDMTHGILANEGFSTSERKGDLALLYIIAEDLLAISEKELKGETISDNEFKMIEGIGGRAEYLAERLKGEWDNYDGMGLAADVYTYHALDGNYCLEETVGNADIIWVVAEINGLLHLTRGATFSYYEFAEPVSSRLTDDEWRERLSKNQIPERPVWSKGLYAPVAPEVKTSYGSTSYPVSGRWGQDW
jgi:Protein of unknown function (DUF3160)/YARHG domain